MNVDQSKVFAIQSHEWGGQLLLMVYNNTFIGLTLSIEELKMRLDIIKNRISYSAYHDYKSYNLGYGYLNYFTLIPVPILNDTASLSNNLKNIGSYYLGLCNHSWNNGVTFNITHVIVKSGIGFALLNYDSANSYDTTWKVINIPNLVNPPSVFLLKMFKENDAENGKYLTANIGENSIVNLSFSDSISRTQLWNLNGNR